MVDVCRSFTKAQVVIAFISNSFLVVVMVHLYIVLGSSGTNDDGK